jgi:zinc transporter ZupT
LAASVAPSSVRTLLLNPKGLYFGEIYKEELLSLTAGGFLYMCLSSIFPDIRESFRE